MEPYTEKTSLYPNVGQPVINQPMPGQTVIQLTVSDPMMPRGVPRSWSTGLMDCCEDMTVCLCTTFVPCYDCIISSDMSESCAVPLCVPGSHIAMRAFLRGRHNIEGNLISDCCMMTWCRPCATCQLAREIKNIKCGKAAP